jgi:hypothetical protein
MVRWPERRHRRPPVTARPDSDYPSRMVTGSVIFQLIASFLALSAVVASNWS